MLAPSEKSRVCLIGNFLSKQGGSPKQCEDLAIRLREAGYQVVTAGRHRNKILRVFDMAFTICRHCRSIRVVLIDTFSYSSLFWAFACGAISLCLRVPYVAVLRGGDLPVYTKRFPRLTQKYLRASRFVVAPSNYLGSWVSSLGLGPVVIPNHIDLVNYTYTPRSELSANLLWLRSYHDIYNPEMAIRALSALVRRGLDARLIMAGSHQAGMARARMFAEEVGLSKRIELHGLVAKKDIDGLGARASIFLNTSRIDNTPVTLLEAAAMGLPIVSTKVGGIPFMFKENEEICFVPDSDAEEMAAQIIRLMANPGMAQVIASNARKVAERCSWDNTSILWQRLIESCKGSHP